MGLSLSFSVLPLMARTGVSARRAKPMLVEGRAGRELLFLVSPTCQLLTANPSWCTDARQLH